MARAWQIPYAQMSGIYKEGPQVRHWLMLPNQALFLPLSCRNGSNKAERYMQKAPAETKAMKCNQRQRERSHTIILPHAPLNQCCFSQSGDLLASKYSTASLPRIQVQWNNQLWFRGEGFFNGAGYFLCCREKHAKRMDQWQRLL